MYNDEYDFSVLVVLLLILLGVVLAAINVLMFFITITIHLSLVLSNLCWPSSSSYSSSASGYCHY